MNKFIISLIICSILILFIFLNNKETFDTHKCGPHTIVDPTEYHIPTKDNPSPRGPSCLTDCIIENVPRVNWNISDPDRLKLSGGVNADILQYNRENPNRMEDYCYQHHSDQGTITDLKNPCNQNCKASCGQTKEKGDARCQIHTLSNSKELCSEATLNMMSSGANLKISKCKECIKKYWNNISNIWDKYEEYIMPNNCSLL